MSAQTTISIPSGECYACSAPVVGVTRRHYGTEGRFYYEASCQRHADPTIDATFRCTFCDGPNPTLAVESGLYAHKSCFRKGCR